ncbi:AraC family transcriptional regulator [Bacillus sp. 7884-1]|uniref:AraC family transcriptional regulator n=1 Tax=Bacillus sp. 7884-1 TaxID=2021693 RepID=UPI0015CAAA6B|nr:AraC family transcriptional regulator [Bacillus sp. 7884-1]
MLVYDQYLYLEKPAVEDDVVVFHSGFCSTDPNYSYGKDSRDYYLIHYVTKGKGTYTIGGKTYYLKIHDGFLITPGSTIVHTADTTDPWDVCWIAFFGKKVDQLLNYAGLNQDHLIFHYEKDDFLEKCIKDIYYESRSTRNIAKITGYFFLFLGKLIENHQATTDKKKEILTFSPFDDAIIYIRRNIRNQISIENLASYLRLDTSQVYRIFKKNTDCSPLQFITKLRVQKACEMLIKTDMSVKEISEWMGFEYQSHFTKQFKKIMGINPSDYRLQNAEVKN